MPLPTAIRPVVDRIAPRNHATVLATVSRLEPLLGLLDPATYPGVDVYALLARDPVGRLAGGPGCEPEVFEAAAQYLGHQVLPATDAQPRALAVLSATQRAERDAVVLASARRAAADAAGLSAGLVWVRATQLRCRRHWVSAWGVRGALERATVAGVLAPHPAARRRPVTVWMFTST